MRNQVDKQPAYVLHARPFRETSLLVEIFSQEHGRVSLLSRGARTQRSKIKSLLQPFIPLLLSWRSTSELGYLNNTEPNGMPPILSGASIVSGLYLNELIMRLLHRFEAHENLFLLYQQTIIKIAHNARDEVALRLFEKRLLEELGYALPLEHAVDATTPLKADCYYLFDPQRGAMEVKNTLENNSTLFSGNSLLALQAECLDDPNKLRDAKRLLRMVINHWLGTKTINSREYFRIQRAP